MKKRILFAALLFLVAGLQTADAQGFRVYQSDGTLLQFSLKTDSIVFDNGLNGDEVFGPFTPVNQCIVGTWYKSKYESVTFNVDGTTDYVDGATYEFMPYQGNVIIYNASAAPVNYFKVLKVTAEKMIVGSPDGSNLSVWSSTKPVQFVTSITLNKTYITLQPDESKRLIATVGPADADNPAVTWESSDDAVAEVNSSGRVTANTYGTCVITCRATDGSDVKAECQVRVKTDTMEWVDLGLPSGTLWATCNVGASSPEEYGDYFAWGETEPKDNYIWNTYKYCMGDYNTLIKYCHQSNFGYNGFTDELTELEPADDAATANWGGGWRMPSEAQMRELFNSENTTTEWTELNGIYGRKITGKNGNSIFMPTAGRRHDMGLEITGICGCYWLRSFFANCPNNAYYQIVSDYVQEDSIDRDYGLSVRAVRVY